MNSPNDDYPTKLLNPAFTNILQGGDIVCLQETKGPVKIPGYVFHDSLRPGDHKSGGVSLGYKRCYQDGIRIIKGASKNPDLIVCKLDKTLFDTCQNTYLITAYAPPRNSSCKFLKSNPNLDTFADILREINALPNNSPIILCGDLNARTASLDDHLPTNERFDHIPSFVSGPTLSLPRRNNFDRTSNAQGKDLIDLCASANLFITNGRTLGDIFGSPTCFKYNGCSSVDYFLVSAALQPAIKALVVAPLNNLSDHAPITLSINLRPGMSTGQDKPSFDEAPRRFRWIDGSAEAFKLAQEVPAVRNRIAERLQQLINTKSDASALYDSVTKIFCDICRDSLRVPCKPKRKSKNKWYGNNLKDLARVRDNLAKAHSSDPHNTEKRESLYAAKRAHTKAAKTAKRCHRRKLIQGIEDGGSLNWGEFKKLKQEINHETPFDEYDLLSFYNHFRTLYETKRSIKKVPADELKRVIDNPTGLFLASQPDQSILDDEIALEEVVSVIKGLRCGKSVSIDLISNEMLKNLSPDMLSLVTKLFNACLSQGYYPWRTSVITPIPKGGNRYDPNEYRAIAVGSCVGKLFSSILLNRLTLFRHEFCRDPPNQLGFQKDAQCNDHLLTLRTIYEKYVVKKKGRLVGCFVDFSKAFDSLARDALLYKIVGLGINGKFFSTLKDMYTNTCSRVKLIERLTDAIHHVNGVEQGHPLSPELFKAFIRDLSSRLNEAGLDISLHFPNLMEAIVNHLLWADDLVLMATNEESLQHLLNILHEFCQDWGLEVNLKKTKVMVFTSSGRLIPPRRVLTLGDLPVECVSKYTYLGISITPNLNMKKPQEELRKKGLRAYFGMRGTINLNDLSNSATLKLFDSLVKPVALYGAQIWADSTSLAKSFGSPNVIKDIMSQPDCDLASKSVNALFKKIASDSSERLHLCTLKWILGVHKKASNIGVWGDTGRTPLGFSAIKLSLDYLQRVESLPPESLTNLAFQEQKRLNLSWYSTLNTILVNYREFLPSSRTDRDNPRVIVSEMETIFKDIWLHSVRSSSKLAFYSSIKQAFAREEYLDLTNKDARFQLTRIRISAHNLEVERGRYANLERCDRLCKACLVIGISSVDDEAHLLYNCTPLGGLRAALTPALKDALSMSLPHPADKISCLSRLFKDVNKNPAHHTLLKQLGLFIRDCFEQRDA